MSGDFEPEQKRYLEGFVAGLQIAKSAKGAGAPPPVASPACGGGSGSGPRRRGAARAGPRHQEPAASCPTRKNSSASCIRSTAIEKLKEQAAKNEAPKADDNFRWRFYRPVLLRAGAERLHVPAAHSQRHPDAIGSSRASPISPSAMPAAMPTSPRAPICRCARSQPNNAVAMVEGDPGARPVPRAAPAPTISATSPARRPPASIRRN